VTGGVTTVGGVTGATGAAITGALAVVKEVVPEVLSPMAFLAITLTLYKVPSARPLTLHEREVVARQTAFPFTRTS
jgi:hypothetical protein